MGVSVGSFIMCNRDWAMKSSIASPLSSEMLLFQSGDLEFASSVMMIMFWLPMVCSVVSRWCRYGCMLSLHWKYIFIMKNLRFGVVISMHMQWVLHKLSILRTVKAGFLTIIAVLILSGLAKLENLFASVIALVLGPKLLRVFWYE